MAHTLTITDGTTTLDLADTAATGYLLIDFRTPRPNRIISRVGMYPFGDGERTVASGLADSEIEITLMIVGSTADDLDTKLQTLVKLLERAQRFEEFRTTVPVRLTFKRQGVTNTAYRVVTGVPRLPEPLDADEGHWLDISSITLTMTVAFTITVEPVAHAGALTTIVNAATLTNQPTDNDATASPAIIGDMSCPLTILLKNTGGVAWANVWLSHGNVTPQVNNRSGTADATAYGGSFITVAGGGTVNSITYSTTTTSPLPIRAIVRVKGIGTPTDSFRLRFILKSAGPTIYGSYVTPLDFDTSWQIVDLGGLSLPDYVHHRPGLSADAVPITVEVEASTTDGSAIDIGIDYIEVLQYWSFIRLSGLVEDTHHARYDMVAEEGSFYWPLRTPQVHVTDATDDFQLGTIGNLTRYGVIPPTRTATTPQFWFAAQGFGSHSITHTGTLTVKYLPCYSLGLRGSI